MKLVTGTLLLFFVIAGVASAQTPSLPTFSHIIIIVQENRTPDNLFGSLASGPCNSANSLPGADLVNGGIGIVKGQQGKTCNTQLAMNFGQDPTHYHQDWINDYDAGLMDGFCDSPEFTWPNCPPYSYVQASDVQPYIAIANTYGFANYMFQTNEGPSFEAHQFLFTGTAAPVAPNDPNGYYWDFLTDNPNFSDSGCTASTHLPLLIQPDGTTTGPGVNYECYTHDSLVTSSTCNQGVCDKNVSWRYYTPTTGIIWDAPESIPEVCYGENDLKNAGGACGSASSGNQAEWKKHMSFYSSYNFAPIFNDIQSCQLAQISWVIPDISWSDHPEANGTGPALGPSWVGNIINAIGNSYASSNQLCDYWGTSGQGSALQPTAIFVVWDDWGGFYDHVPPPAVLIGSPSGKTWTCPQQNQWGCGYTYGFRVPLLVVSEFTGTKSNEQYGNYISGACGIKGQLCPNKNPFYQHDFGSILAFTENNFNLPKIATPYYADNNTFDSFKGNIPLSDFFPLYTGSGSGRSFVSIPVTPYPASFFESYYATHNVAPTGPDTD